MNYHKNISENITINPQTFEGDYKDENLVTSRISGTYLHGDLQAKNGYDIFGIVGNLPTSTGIFPAKIIGRENDECTFFLWVGTDKYTHGLVVLNSDKQDMEYALGEYNKRSSFL